MSVVVCDCLLASSFTPSCLHHGVFNASTMTCQCHDFYSGFDCQFSGLSVSYHHPYKQSLIMLQRVAEFSPASYSITQYFCRYNAITSLRPSWIPTASRLSQVHWFLPRDAMHKRDAVMRCLSVCLSRS